MRALASPYGEVLGDGTGYALYLLRTPTGGSARCDATCQAAGWVPYLLPSDATGISTGPGVDGHLGTIVLADGRRQVTDNGFPLYGCIRDSVPTEYRCAGLPAVGVKGTFELVRATATTAAETPVPAADRTAEHSAGHRSS